MLKQVKPLYGLAVLGFFVPSALLANEAIPKKPQRVVSMNLCTDQLAMLVAGQGQLLSVSHIAIDQSASLMADQAAKLHINHGLAEEVVRLDPDLVIAGTYTTRATVNLLKRLNYKLVEFSPAYSFADIDANLKKMGELLGQEDQAGSLIAQLHAQIASAANLSSTNQQRLTLGAYGANSYTTGKNSLESEVVQAAGFKHLGSQLDIVGTSKLPLENLIVANPDILMSWQRWQGSKGRSTEVLTHPALEQWFGPERQISVDSRYWICGTPYTAQAIEQLQKSVAAQGDKND